MSEPESTPGPAPSREGTPAVVLRKGAARPAWAGHPDVYDGAVEEVRGGPATGDEVDVLDHGGRYVGRGVWHGEARVRVRIHSRVRGALDEAFVRRRVNAAVALRRDLLRIHERADAYRLVHGAGDRFPGLVVDRYGDFAVVQVTTRAAADRREWIAAVLLESAGVKGVWERAQPRHAEAEGFHPGGGRMAGEAPPDLVEIREEDVVYQVDLLRGSKTGHFLDQRENRLALAPLSAGRSVLDVFSGTGGFGLTALVRGGARSVLAVDAGARALESLARNAARNGVEERVETLQGDAFATLRELQAAGRRFGVVVLDPPRFARSRAELRGALRGYADLNRVGLELLEPGGILATSSCTGALEESAFETVVRDAGVEARRTLQVLRRGGQGPDHPWLTSVPEGRYLKHLVVRAG